MGDDRQWKKVSAGELDSYSAIELGMYKATAATGNCSPSPP